MRPQILWIDDEVTQSDALVSLLACAGFAIDCAATAGEGLALIRSRIHDLIILDERLPDGSGLEILAQLRLERVSVPVILVTGYPDNEIGIRAMKLGAVDVRFKPLDDEEMAQTMRAALALAPARGGPESPCRSHLGTVLAAVDACATRDAMLAALLRAMVHDGTDIRHFVAFAAGFRGVRTVQARSVAKVAMAARRAIFDELALFREPSDVRLGQFLELLRTSPKHRSESEWAHDVGLERSRFSALLNEQLGVKFHACRSGAALRSALKPLLTTQEHVG
jgi:ActR/RegA family two-component response regulator